MDKEARVCVVCYDTIQRGKCFFFFIPCWILYKIGQKRWKTLKLFLDMWKSLWLFELQVDDENDLLPQDYVGKAGYIYWDLWNLSTLMSAVERFGKVDSV